MAEHAPPLRVLFVCTANICRSAYAVCRAPHYLPAGHLVEWDSAGTYGLTDHPMSEPMQLLLGQRCGDGSGHRSSPVSAAQIERADLILTMEAAHRVHLLDDYPTALTTTFTLTQFAAALADLDPLATGRALIAAAWRSRPAAGPDVEDPYRLGLAANAACADRIDALLAQIVPRLVLPAEPGGRDGDSSGPAQSAGST